MNKAKELFFNHNCSWTILHSKRKLGEYLSYEIDEQTEMAWTRYYINDIIRNSNADTLYDDIFRITECGKFIEFEDLIVKFCYKARVICTNYYVSDKDKILLCDQLNNIKYKTTDKNVRKWIIGTMRIILLTINKNDLINPKLTAKYNSLLISVTYDRM